MVPAYLTAVAGWNRLSGSIPAVSSPLSLYSLSLCLELVFGAQRGQAWI